MNIDFRIKTVRKATELEPDLILMDIMLKKGGIDGVEAAQIIHQELNLPIVYLTAHTDLNTLERAKATKPFGYIVKPFEEKDLYTTIEIALARSKAEAEIQKTLKKEQELNELKSRVEEMQIKSPDHLLIFEHHSLIEKAEIDEQLLWHILNNLISNAIKYSPAKSPIKIKLTSQLDQAIIIIIEGQGTTVTVKLPIQSPTV